MKREWHVLSLGAGVQSTTLYLMFLRGDLKPQIDAAIFADTQEEPAAVYQHLQWLLSLHGPTILVRTVGKLGNDLMSGKNGSKRFASIPAFVTPDGGKTVSITRRQCSQEYKTDVIHKTIRRELIGLEARQRIPKSIEITSYMGISMEEAGRAARIREMFRQQHRSFTPQFPLIERFMTRANCIDWLVRYGVPHETPRSACSFCPYHNDYEWDRIKREDPPSWQRAVEIDKALRTDGMVVNRDLRQQMYLHRSCQPLDLVQLDTRPDPRKQQLAFNFSVECEGMCGI